MGAASQSRSHLVPNPDNIRLGLIGSSAGNGHPYSWGAIFNGYHPGPMREECPFPGILDYLDKEDPATIAIPGVEVTHVHSRGDGGFTAESVARAIGSPEVVAEPEDLIGKVDAVVIATDRGSEHVERARPFVEARVPLFIDKPLVTSAKDLAVFRRWIDDGAVILSSSSMRYAREFQPWRRSTADLGDLRFVTITSMKSWEAYAIHALEAVYPILGAGFTSVRNTGTTDRNVAHLTHRSGADVVVAVHADMFGAFGHLQLCGTKDSARAAFSDTFHAFKAQLEAFVEYLRTGTAPFPFDETAELMKLVIAGIRSRDEGGRAVLLEEIDG